MNSLQFHKEEKSLFTLKLTNDSQNYTFLKKDFFRNYTINHIVNVQDNLKKLKIRRSDKMSACIFPSK